MIICNEKTIDMCYTAGHVHLLGGHKCTFGPSYWCHTIAHAEACKVGFILLLKNIFEIFHICIFDPTIGHSFLQKQSMESDALNKNLLQLNLDLPFA